MKWFILWIIGFIVGFWLVIVWAETAQTTIVTHPPKPLPACPNLPPVCAGGLLPQTATTAQINIYQKKYLSACLPTNSCKCRYMEPPRCPKNFKRTCLQECTP